jgi:DNA-binding NarL/FixJ family response regulator
LAEPPTGADTTTLPEAATPADTPTGTVVVLADDLIWASRLADAIAAAGATPARVRRLADLEAALSAPGGAGLAIIDLTARAYDGVAAIRAARDAGARVAAVGQHDDAPLRRAATEAGAGRVFTYRALFEDGGRLLRGWLAR